MLEMRLRTSREEARKLHVRLGVRKPEHIDPVDAARALGIEVVSGHLFEATARIFRAGSRATIRVSDRIVHPGRRRFSIAHELGHQILGHELPGESEISRFVSRACERRKSIDEDPEREADVFATEFLTPAQMARPFCEVSPVSLEAVRAIERAFGSSPVASALRFVELTSERCAVVYCERGEVKWAKRSSTFAWEIPKRMRLSSDSVAYDYFKRGAIEDVAEPVPADAWLHDLDRDVSTIDIVEHAQPIPEPGWGGVMSLLWLSERSAMAVGLE